MYIVVSGECSNENNDEVKKMNVFFRVKTVEQFEKIITNDYENICEIFNQALPKDWYLSGDIDAIYNLDESISPDRCVDLRKR
jgi:hypothetical protein